MKEPDGSSPDAEGPFAVTLTAITRSLLYSLKTLPRTMIKASLQKHAFLAIGRRTASGVLAAEAVPSASMHHRTLGSTTWVWSMHDWFWFLPIDARYLY